MGKGLQQHYHSDGEVLNKSLAISIGEVAKDLKRILC